MEAIQRAIASGHWALTSHARMQAGKRYVESRALVQALVDGEILEAYPEDPRGPSALLLGYAGDGRPLHTVCALDPSGTLLVITVYEPEPPRWLDYRTRGPRGEE